MKLLKYFDAFLKNEVNLNDSRINLLDQRVNTITDFLKGHTTYTESFLDTIPQGSYAHKTIIRPVKEGDEFDADLLLYMKEMESWEASDYVEQLYKAFRSSGVYRDLAKRRSRCVVLDYAGDFHLDVVPYLERHDAKYITNRHENCYELTNPEGFSAWLDGQNRVANGYLLKVIRLLKYLRNFKRTFSVKSIVLTTLVGERVNDAALLVDKNAYHDVPSTMRTVMNSLSTYLEANEDLPSIMDPSDTGENLSDRWHQDGYATFREKIISYAKKFDEAFLEPDQDKSIVLWQGIFGEAFKKPEEKPEEKTARALVDSRSFRNTEQSLSSLGIKLLLDARHHVRIQGHVLKRDGFRTFDLASNGNTVRIGRNIRFSITHCDVLWPYQIYWKVRNRGPEAERQDCIRGEIVKGSRVWKIDEQTNFPGPHYVECYIVKEGVCVAYDRQPVNIMSQPSISRQARAS